MTAILCDVTVETPDTLKAWRAAWEIIRQKHKGAVRPWLMVLHTHACEAIAEIDKELANRQAQKAEQSI